jgi:hypothetical protein
VEKIIALKIPDKFAICFDGWSAGDTHYIGVFAVFQSSSSEDYTITLLSFLHFLEKMNSTLITIVIFYYGF